MIEIRSVAGTNHEVHAVLFDMDGTIVDSVAATERIWGAWAADHGVADRLVIDHGRPAEITIRATMPHVTEDELAELLLEQRHREASDLDGVVPIPGAHELMAWLDETGIPWAVVTSADSTLARARLGACGIEPPILVTRDDVVEGKPHPEPFLLGAARVEVAAHLCLVVEDSDAGLASGTAAGARTASVGRPGGDLQVRDMRDLLEQLGGTRP